MQTGQETLFEAAHNGLKAAMSDYEEFLYDFEELIRKDLSRVFERWVTKACNDVMKLKM